jgi:protoheme IX farnesyltransferase
VAQTEHPSKYCYRRRGWYFWALALCVKDDYKRVGLPMLPVVKGDDATLKQIFYYTLVLVLISLALLFTTVGWLYVVAAAVLGGLFIKKSYETRKDPTISRERGLFGYSIVYLLALFSAIIVDALI